jgi:hypothetical protein
MLFKKSKPITPTHASQSPSPKEFSQQVPLSLSKSSDEIEHTISSRLSSTISMAESNRKMNGESEHTELNKKRIVFLFRDNKPIDKTNEYNRKYENRSLKQQTVSKLNVNSVKVAILTRKDELTSPATVLSEDTMMSVAQQTTLNSPNRLATQSPKKAKRCVHSIQELTSRASKILTPLKISTIEGSKSSNAASLVVESVTQQLGEKSNEAISIQSNLSSKQQRHDLEKSPPVALNVNVGDEDFLDISISDNLNTLI